MDEPSDGAPGGCQGHRVILPKRTAENALESLEGMAVNFRTGYDGHDVRGKCGVITKAWIDGNELVVRGHLYLRDFPELARQLDKPGVELGMSYELYDAHVKNMKAAIWTFTKVTFTGAAIVLRGKAAYRQTRFNVSAAEEVFTGRVSFIEPAIRTGRVNRS